MSLTLEELKVIQKVVSWVRGSVPNLHWSEIDLTIKNATDLLEREIKLKETDFVRMTDVNGNSMEGGD